MRPTARDEVAWSVGRSVTTVSPAKMAEMTEIPFGCKLGCAPGTIHHMQRGNFEGEKGPVQDMPGS